MPSIASRIVTNPRPVSTPVSPTPRPVPPLEGPTPVQNTMLRCPLPYVVSPSPDSLRQFYGGGTIPQYRITPSPSLK